VQRESWKFVLVDWRLLHWGMLPWGIDRLSNSDQPMALAMGYPG
jgi:hypothetical protein